MIAHPQRPQWLSRYERGAVQVTRRHWSRRDAERWLHQQVAGDGEVCEAMVGVWKPARPVTP